MPNPETKQKIKEFVDHLLSNPNIKNEPLVIGEGLLLNFLVQNMNQLKSTFKSPQFFPDLEWNQVLQLILSDLYERIVSTEFPVINDFLNNANFDFLNKIGTIGTFGGDFHQKKLSEFVLAIFKNRDVRYNFNSIINIFKFKTIERYVGEIFTRRGPLYNELVRVQKTYLDAEDYINFTKILLLIRNSVFTKFPLNPNTKGDKLTLKDYLNSPVNFNKYFTPFIRMIHQELPNLDERTISLAIKSNIGEKQTEVEDASSRFLYILISRYKSYKPISKIDRGAESPDKSWFGIAKKNADSQGYDKRMLEALYIIAGDNNW